jgi:CRISPR/Cas system-associated exonuclease Cas4 (RecB family)
MTLPDGFLFTQSNLQDYIDCHRRFQLRYLLHLAWPAVEAEPYLEYEHWMEKGAQFHRVIRQHLSGVHGSQIETSLGNDLEIMNWWMNYKQSLQDGLLKKVLDGGMHYEEITLSTSLNRFRLLAKYDLLVINPSGKLIIMDWKTSQTRPRRKWLADRLQTHVYSYLLASAMSSLEIKPTPDTDRIEMIYWFANYPDQPESFCYNRKTFGADRRYLESIASSIEQLSAPVFPLTPDLRRCLFCTYRSLCDRGVNPGKLHQLEEWQEAEISTEGISIDYDQISEIEF